MRSHGLSLVLGLLTLASSVYAFDAEAPLDDPAQRALYEQLTEEVRCLVCQNQTIADSSAPLAEDLRREIRKRVTQGQNEAQIKDFLTARYGDFVLYRPRYGGPSAVLWIAPGLMVLIGMIVLWKIVRRRSVLPVTTEAQDAIVPADRQEPLQRD
jgi:cytochrome c-type biogenesis protein CcmH